MNRPTPAWLTATVALAVLLGVFFRFYQLDGKVFWEDEILGTLHTLGYTEAEVVEASPQITNAAGLQHYVRPLPSSDDRPLSATIGSLAAEDPQHPPAYYLAARLWTNVAGTTPAGIRSLSAAFGVLVLPCVLILCLELFGSLATALIAVALVALSPFHVLYAQEAREYSLWTVAIVLLSWLLLRAARSAAWWPWIVYAGLAALALYIYPLSGLVIVGLFLYLLLRERLRPTPAVIGCALASIVALASFVPWLRAMTSSHGLASGMSGIFAQKLTPGSIAFIFARNLRFPYFDFGSFRIGPLGSTSINFVLTVVAVALSIYALVVLVRRHRYAVWGLILVGLCLPMVPLLLQDLFVHGRFVYQARYFIPLLLGIQLAVAALFSRWIFGGSSPSAARRAWITLFAGVLVAEALSCVVSARASTWWNKDYERTRDVAAIVNAAPNPVVVSDYYLTSILGLGYYLDPNVALQLVAKCTQCTTKAGPAPSPGSAAGTTKTVYLLQQEPPPSDGRGQWIDPLTFPSRPDPLNMFLAI